jgi:hypothetical protein
MDLAPRPLRRVALVLVASAAFLNVAHFAHAQELGERGASIGPIEGSGTLGTIGNGGRDTSRNARGSLTRVRLLQTTVTGRGLSRGTVRRELNRNIARVRHCYESELVRHPDLAGRLTVRFVVGAGGHVATASSSDLLGSQEVGACLSHMLRQLVFPGPRADVVVVQQTFELSLPRRR